MNVITHYWLEFLCSAIVGLLAMGVREIKKVVKMQKDFKGGLKALLCDAISHIYKDCYKRGYMIAGDRRRIQDLYEHYHNLGGNGMIDAIMKKVNDISIMPDDFED